MVDIFCPLFHAFFSFMINIPRNLKTLVIKYVTRNLKWDHGVTPFEGFHLAEEEI